MLNGTTADQCIEEKRSRPEIDNGRADDTNRIFVPARKTGSYRRSNVGTRPNHKAGIRMERIHIIRCGHNNNHWAVWAALNIERLGVHIARDGPIKV